MIDTHAHLDALEGVLDNVDSISGPKRKQNLTEHGEDARISKQLATMHTDIDVELDLPALMERGPDLSQLRETAAEFELRQVIQRLEDDWEGDVPDRPADELIDVDATEGTIADLGDGEIALAIGAGRWGGYDGERLVAGELPEPAALVAALAGHPLVAHDFKSMAGHSPRGLLADLAAGSLDLAHDTMVAAYLIDPARRTYELDELAADEGFTVSGAKESDASDGQLSLEDGEDAGDPTATARLAWELTGRQRSKLADLGLAHALKDLYYATNTSEPQRALAAATALGALARANEHPEIQALAAWTAGMAAVQIEAVPG